MTIAEQLQLTENFTETEKTVIAFLLQNGWKLEKMTVHEIAEATFSSNASILRLCKKLGYKKFHEFKMAFMREQESGKFVVNQVDYSLPFKPQASTMEVVNSIYSLYSGGIDLIQSQMSISDLERMVAYLLKSNRIFLFGIGDVKLTLKSFMNKLLKIGCFPILATENIEERHVSTFITSKDCALFVTYGGNYISYADCLRILRRNHVPVLLLTANPNCELYRYSTCRICIPDQEKTEKVATFYSQIVFEYLLNLLYSLVYLEVKKKS